MAYDLRLADRIRVYLLNFPGLQIEERRMFRGLTFMVNGKMCVSGDDLMCRFDPTLQEAVAERTGFRTMIMKGKEYKGYCYVDVAGLKSKKDFEYWISLCLDYNESAKSSRKNK